MPRIIEKRLIEEFKNRDSFTREELFKFYRYSEPDLKPGTFGWRIYDLKARNIIKTVKRSLYIISYKPKYEPEIGPILAKLAKKITKKYSEVKFCIWDTAWLNEFSQHQANKRIIIIEIEKEFVESLYFHLKDNFKYEFYLNPDETAIGFYISESQNPIVLKRLITRSPIVRATKNKLKIPVPSLEKILVDLHAEEKLFFFHQGSELGYIYENVIRNYVLNFTKLFSYAKRRDRENEIKSYLNNNMGYLLKDILDD